MGIRQGGVYIHICDYNIIFISDEREKYDELNRQIGFERIAKTNKQKIKEGANFSENNAVN